MAEKSFLRHAAVYALGDVLVMAGGFVLLPIYARRLSLPEFGLLEVLERLAEVTAICFLTRGIALATLTHYQQGGNDRCRRQVVAAGLVLMFVVVLGGVIGAAAAAGPLGYLLAVDQTFLVWMAVVATLLEGITMVIQAVNQARYRSGFFVAVSFAQFLTKVTLCVLFVVGLGWGAGGVVLASLVRALLVSGALVWGEWRHGLLWPDSQTFRQLIGFALPFLPTGLCFFVLNSGDRFFLVRQAGAGEVGIYGLGYRLAMLVGLFSVTPLNRVWSARVYDAAEKPDAPQVFGQMATRILGAYLLVGLALCLFAEEAIRIFAGRGFERAAEVVPPVVLAYWFFAAGVLMESAFYLRRRTHCKSWIALASTAVMLLAYFFLIPRHGALGAAVATLIGFMFHAVLTGATAQRVFPVRYEWGRLTALVGLAVALWIASRFIADEPWAIPAKIGIWLLWPAALWAFGLVSPAEKEWARATVARVYQSFLAITRRLAARLRRLRLPNGVLEQ